MKKKFELLFDIFFSNFHPSFFGYSNHSNILNYSIIHFLNAADSAERLIEYDTQNIATDSDTGSMQAHLDDALERDAHFKDGVLHSVRSTTSSSFPGAADRASEAERRAKLSQEELELENSG